MCFLAKKCASRRAALYKNMLSSPFRIVFFGVFLCVCRISHQCLRCFCRLSTSCTCQLRFAFVFFQLCAGVGGGDLGGGGGDVRLRLAFVFRLCAGVGGMGERGDNVHANAARAFLSFVALLLKRCRLLCEAFVAASCCFTFETSTKQKTSSF